MDPARPVHKRTTAVNRLRPHSPAAFFAKCQPRSKSTIEVTSHTVSKTLNIDVDDIVYLYCDRNKSRSRCRYLVVSVDGVWLNVSKFIGNQLRATSYRVKRSECYKVAAHTLGPPTAYQYDDSTSTPTYDTTPKPRSSIPTQLLYPVTPDDAQSVHPIPDAQTPVVPDEEKQESENEENFPAEELPPRPSRRRRPPEYLSDFAT